MALTLIGDGEHSRVVREALGRWGWPPGLHVAFVGKPGTPNRRDYIKVIPEGTELATIVHPTAHVSESAYIGGGSFIGAGAIVQAGAHIGYHCVINTGAIVEHDCQLGTGVHVAPRAVIGGGTWIGSWTTIGLGACVRDHIRIGESAIVAMGAVVVKDVPSGVTVKGVPAK